MKRIRFECIGMSFQKKAPNGMLMSGVVVDDPAEFPLYELLGLDVFDNSPAQKNIAKVTEVIPVVEKKKGKKNATS